MSKKIPLFNLNYGEQELQAVKHTLDSKWISTGPKCEKLEEQFAKKIGSKYSLATTNCTAALHLALVTAGIGAGDEVLVPSLSFVATANVVRYAGAKPVFCDIIDLQDLTIDPAEIELRISPTTKAIIPMHYAGFGSNMEAIQKIADNNDLLIIEDASHAPLATYENKKLGAIGDIGCFSFYSNKNISTGEGGMLVTDNQDYFKKAKLLRSHGMTSLAYNRKDGNNAYDVIELGYNYRMDDIRASLGLAQLEKLERDMNQLQHVRDYYVQALHSINDIIVPFQNYQGRSTNYIFPIVLKSSNIQRRENIRNYLKEQGIQTSVHYPAIHEFSIYKNDAVALPKTEYIARNEITLPMFPTLQESDIDYIVEMLKKAL
ncbi:MAG: DegT/DnrJ/EryC1/StrS family aminotransferase [Candidatus Marinimicrobia bacterium]|nr:DegT/DnrJ/EryC1/StrS family aminotransferase [Candidatus Neomarinimicrobiota bacterium]